MVDYVVDYVNLSQCLVSYVSASPETELANQTPQGLFVKKMTIGLPFRYNKDLASLFVKKFGMASLFVKKPCLYIKLRMTSFDHPNTT